MTKSSVHSIFILFEVSRFKFRRDSGHVGRLKWLKCLLIFIFKYYELVFK